MPWYDGAATFSGNRTGVQTRMKVHAAMPSTFTVPATDCSLLPFKLQMLWERSEGYLVL